MPAEVIRFPFKEDTLGGIFQALMEIGEVVEIDQATEETPSITSPHCGKTFPDEK